MSRFTSRLCQLSAPIKAADFVLAYRKATSMDMRKNHCASWNFTRSELVACARLVWLMGSRPGARRGWRSVKEPFLPSKRIGEAAKLSKVTRAVTTRMIIHAYRATKHFVWYTIQ